MIEVVDQIKEVEASRFSQYGLLGQLAASMVVRDELLQQKRAARAEWYASGEPLLQFSHDLWNESDLSTFAVVSPELVHIKHKIDAISKAIREVDLWSRLTGTYPLDGLKARVSATDPNLYNISTVRINSYGGHIALSRQHKQRSGTVTGFNAMPTHGGWIKLLDHRSKLFTASPLVDRDNDYKIAFDILPYR